MCRFSSLCSSVRHISPSRSAGGYATRGVGRRPSLGVVVATVSVVDHWCSSRGRYVLCKNVRWFDSVDADAGVLAADPYSMFHERYADDIFVIIESGKEEAFLNYLNSLFPNTISFTIEKEMSGQLKTTVYRKPTHSNRYLHFSSHHPRAVMKGIIRGMVKRAIDLCEPEFLREELHRIYKTFKENGYPS
ncbi:hypothetical protein M514_25435 [Trichuris suis]|uniref:Helix-turn-helix domain-containing protein n=1 Tax=Trichuris suis TaxID=68888 RepID=A0A085MYY1_9BILA|nr:hypothetical protein M514_25435 [Trichuris suis]